MTKRTYEILGMVLWVIFVHLIAPDIPYVRSLLAALVGWAAIWLIATGTSSANNESSGEAKKIQAEGSA